MGYLTSKSICVRMLYMDNINVGDTVYWVQKTKTREIERVGQVIGIVQPECSPNKIIPNFVRDTISLRNFVSYLVKVNSGGQSYIFWPSRVIHIPETKKHLLTTMAPVTTTRTFIIDHKDRLLLKRICKELGVDFTESDEHLNVPSWGKRFVFRVLNGEEFISYIEVIKIG